MNNSNSKKNKHLSFDDRSSIQECLNFGMTFKAIAARIDKDQTTISKEVKKHLIINDSNYRRNDRNGNPVKLTPCPSLLKAPFICNPCKRKNTFCSHQKQFYNAKNAQGEYEDLLSKSREGIPLNKETFYEIDKIVTDGIKSGQHLYHIMNSNDLTVSKSTIYRHLKLGYLSASTLDFPRVVKFKPRKIAREVYIPKALKISRTHDDFIAYLQENDISTWVELDTVIGRIGGKVIMTLNFTLCNFIFGFLLDNKTALEVAEKFIRLKNTLNSYQLKFADLFPLILTDNGGEFSNVFAIENNSLGEKETMLFFCDPYNSSQKARIEKNHTMLRDILPKGTSFDDLSQSNVDMIFSHINSVRRKSLNGKTAYDIFSFTFGTDVAEALGIISIPPDKIIQSPRLLNLLN